MATKAAVRIPVRLDSGQAKKDAAKFSSEMQKSFTKTVDVVQAARLAFEVAGAALGKLVGITKEAVELASEQERVERRVMSIANMRGKFTQQDFERLQEHNAARQQSLGIGDEEQLQLQSLSLIHI